MFLPICFSTTYASESLLWNREIGNEDSVHKQNTRIFPASAVFSISFRNLLAKLYHEIKSQGDEGKANVILPQVISILIQKN